MMIPSPRLALLASLLDLPTHRSWGALTHHLVFRGSLATFHATLTKLGVVHDWSTGADGPELALMGLNVSSGGYGGVLVEDPAVHDVDPGVVHCGRPVDVPEKAAGVPPEASPVVDRPLARSRSEARRLAVQLGTGDPADWPKWINPEFLSVEELAKLRITSTFDAPVDGPPVDHVTVTYAIAYPPGQSADHYDSPASVQGVSDAYAMGDWMRRDAGRD